MLTALAFGMVITFMTLIMTKRVSALVALTLVPSVFGLLGGFGSSLGPMMLNGLREVAPTGVMLLFAILYFGIMIDAGLFDPLVAAIVRIARGDPLRITLSTAALALLVSLDGDGTTTYMISTSAVLPLYRRLQLDLRKMACLIIVAAAITNVVPWGGPTARVAAALKLDPSVLFVPLIPALLGCVVWLFCVAYFFGVRERKRLERADGSAAGSYEATVSGRDEEPSTRDPAALRPRRFVWNLLLTAALMTMLVTGWTPLPVLFMAAVSLALLTNYPSLAEQKERVAAHAGNALSVASLVFAAGIFMGILSGTGMIDAMAASVLGVLPATAGPRMAVITALLSIPFTFFISNDAFYFGMVPILASTAAAYGLAPEDIARASLIGQQIHLLSPLVPSTYLLVAMARIDLGTHQRFTLPWALGSCVVMLVCASAFGAFPVHSYGAR